MKLFLWKSFLASDHPTFSLKSCFHHLLNPVKLVSTLPTLKNRPENRPRGEKNTLKFSFIKVIQTGTNVLERGYVQSFLELVSMQCATNRCFSIMSTYRALLYFAQTLLKYSPGAKGRLPSDKKIHDTYWGKIVGVFISRGNYSSPRSIFVTFPTPN